MGVFTRLISAVSVLAIGGIGTVKHCLAGLDPCMEIGGAINEDVAWAADQSPYCVTESVVIDSGATLTVEPGVEVRFGAGLSLTVGTDNGGAGTLFARGTADRPVVFTSGAIDRRPGDWNGIRFARYSVAAQYDADSRYSGGSILEYVVVEYAGVASGAIVIDYSSPYLVHSTVRNNAKAGVVAELVGRYSTPIRIEGCTIAQNVADGVRFIECDFASLIGNVISGNGAATGTGGAVFYHRPSASLIGNVISGNGTEGGQGGAAFESCPSLNLDSNTITHNRARLGGGVRLYYSPLSTLRGNAITNNTAVAHGGVMLYMCDSVLMDRNAILENSPTGVSVSSSNGLTATGNTIIGSSRSGVGLSFGTATLTRNTISSNGVGVSLSGGVATLTQNLITHNSVGGGVYLFSSSSGSLDGNVISDNRAGDAGLGGGGIGVFDRSSVTSAGDILLRNSAAGPGGAMYIGFSSSAVLEYSILAGNGSEVAGFASGGVFATGYSEVSIGAGVTILSNGVHDLWNNNPVSAQSNTIDARNVWWGTQDEAAIRRRIWDFDDDATKGVVTLIPWMLTGLLDFNGDGEIRQDDVHGLTERLSTGGPGVLAEVGCAASGDLDRDGDVDLRDVALIQWLGFALAPP